MTNKELTAILLLLTSLRKQRLIPDNTYQKCVTLLTPDGEGLKELTISKFLEMDDEDSKVPVNITTKGAKYLEEVFKDSNLVGDYPGQHLFDLTSLDKNEVRRLGFTLIDQQLYKRWGTSLNTQLYNIMLETRNYYREHLHPTTKIDKYKEDITEAMSAYSAAVVTECNLILDYELERPMKVFKDFKTGVTVYLKRITPAGKWIYQSGKKGEVEGDQHMFNIPTNLKEKLLKNYYKYKSRSK